MSQRLVFFLLSLLGAPIASADTINLANGDRVSGVLVSVDGTRVVIDSEWGGRLLIEREAVQAIETDEEMGVEVTGSADIEGRLVATASGEQGLLTAAGDTREIGIGALGVAYPR